MFHNNNPHLQHGVNVVVASLPLASWFSHLPAFFTGLAGFLTCMFYIPIVYDEWTKRLQRWKDRRKK